MTTTKTTMNSTAPPTVTRMTAYGGNLCTIRRRQRVGRGINRKGEKGEETGRKRVKGGGVARRGNEGILFRYVRFT